MEDVTQPSQLNVKEHNLLAVDEDIFGLAAAVDGEVLGRHVSIFKRFS